MLPNVYELISGSFEKYANNVCLSFPEKKYTYSDIFTLSCKVTKIIRESKSKYIGVLANRSLSGYLGCISILQSGKIYVPLNPKLPKRQLEKIISLSNLNTIIVDNDSLDILLDLIPDQQLTLIAPELNPKLPKEHSAEIDIISLPEICELEVCEEAFQPHHGGAYLLFTSGSTGEPKGIEGSHESLCDYLNYTQQRLQLNSQDKCSQIFDLSFDLSIHDLLLSWMNGATLCIPDKKAFNPVKYVTDNNLTVWFSVPSLIGSLLKYNFLKPNIFPSLRISLFCGEALSAAIVEKWQIAAPKSIIENIYGPTEATIGISSYQWKPNDTNKVRNGIVSIGKIFPTQKYFIAEEYNQSLSANTGELLLSGSQVIKNYFVEEENTSTKFKTIGEDNPILYYKTGDVVVEDDDGYLFFLQRKDHQFKIKGYRIEEEEINEAIRKATNIQNVITLPGDAENGLVQEIFSFIEFNGSLDEREVIKECHKLLPPYMIPKRIYAINQFPKNINGKIDRSYFVHLLNEYNSI